MVDYQKIESDHLRRIGDVLLSDRSEAEKELVIDALSRYRDYDIDIYERIERADAERSSKAEADAKALSDVLAILGIIAVFGGIALGLVAAFVP